MVLPVEYIGLMADIVLPAIPDFKWGHATNGEVDRDGYCIVTVKVRSFCKLHLHFRFELTAH